MPPRKQRKRSTVDLLDESGPESATEFDSFYVEAALKDIFEDG